MKKLIVITILTLPILFFLQGCGHTDNITRLQGVAQGTYYNILYCDRQHRDLKPQIDSILNEFDLSASLWIDSSLIRKINRGEDSILNSTLERLFNMSIMMNTYTGGAFDCRVGSLVNAWGFGFKARQSLSEQEVDSLLHICHAPIHIRQNSEGQPFLKKDDSRTEIDFNAIAQGYSVDLVGKYFESLNISDYLIDIGGEVLAKGRKPNGSEWSVGIERPAPTKESTPEVIAAISLRDASVVTSGNYRKYYEKDGQRYSHTINPATGYPVQHTLLSVSVVDQYAWRADALATAFMVMGLDSSLAFIAQHPEYNSVYFIYDDNGTYKTYGTDSFNKLIR